MLRYLSAQFCMMLNLYLKTWATGGRIRASFAVIYRLLFIYLTWRPEPLPGLNCISKHWFNSRTLHVITEGFESFPDSLRGLVNVVFKRQKVGFRVFFFPFLSFQCLEKMSLHFSWRSCIGCRQTKELEGLGWHHPPGWAWGALLSSDFGGTAGMLSCSSGASPSAGAAALQTGNLGVRLRISPHIQC